MSRPPITPEKERRGQRSFGLGLIIAVLGLANIAVDAVVLVGWGNEMSDEWQRGLSIEMFLATYVTLIGAALMERGNRTLNNELGF